MMTNEELYNCQNNEAPDWTRYDAYEIWACDCVDGYCDAITDSDYEVEGTLVYTVYGHLKTGGVEAITDCDTYDKASEIARLFADNNPKDIYDMEGLRKIERGDK